MSWEAGPGRRAPTHLTVLQEKEKNYFSETRPRGNLGIQEQSDLFVIVSWNHSFTEGIKKRHQVLVLLFSKAQGGSQGPGDWPKGKLRQSTSDSEHCPDSPHPRPPNPCWPFKLVLQPRLPALSPSELTW